MRYLILLSVLVVGCASKKDVSINHHFCVMSDPKAVGEDRYTCNVTANFHSVGLCQSFEEWERKDNPDAYKDGRLKTKCEKE
jgi:hypothetical protein